jgi:hypothetical protein
VLTAWAGATAGMRWQKKNLKYALNSALVQQKSANFINNRKISP